MEKVSYLSKIKFKPFLNLIFDFIKGVNIKLNLLKYSKHLQRMLDINIFNYQNAYFKKENFYTSIFEF